MKSSGARTGDLRGAGMSFRQRPVNELFNG